MSSLFEVRVLVEAENAEDVRDQFADLAAQYRSDLIRSVVEISDPGVIDLVEQVVVTIHGRYQMNVRAPYTDHAARLAEARRLFMERFRGTGDIVSPWVRMPWGELVRIKPEDIIIQPHLAELP